MVRPVEETPRALCVSGPCHPPLVGSFLALCVCGWLTRAKSVVGVATEGATRN